jgi:hypothetical protein
MNTWSDFTPIAQDGNLMTFSASTLNDLATFTFTIAQADSGAITANKMKIDFLLENYPWAAGGDTFVALICSVETERQVEIETEEEDGPASRQAMDVIIDFEDAVSTIGFVPFGEYTWAETAEATPGDSNNTTVAETNTSTRSSETIAVIGTTPVNVAYRDIAFSFVGAGQGASRIYWDPEAGIGYSAQAQSSGVSMRFVWGFAATAVSFVLILALL